MLRKPFGNPNKTYKVSTKAIAWWIAYLSFEAFKAGILEAVMKEFIARGLEKTYAKKIAEWQKYYREKKFVVKLDKQMRKEIERFTKSIKKWKPKELEVFVIEGLDCLQSTAH